MHRRRRGALSVVPIEGPVVAARDADLVSTNLFDQSTNRHTVERDVKTLSKLDRLVLDLGDGTICHVKFSEAAIIYHSATRGNYQGFLTR
jgi:hypothetical protein